MKKFAALFLAATRLTSGPALGAGVQAHAAETPPIVANAGFRDLTPKQIAELPYITIERADFGPSTRADVIEWYIVRDKNTGKRYARRWNATWGYWVDPDWIPID